MEKNKYLNEEKYEKTKKKICLISIIVLIIGFLLGGGLIAAGIINQNKINNEYSEENRASIAAELEAEKQNLLELREKLEKEIEPVQEEIKQLEREEFTGFNDEYYARKDRIEELEDSIADSEKEISVIDGALAEISSCTFNSGQSAVTAEYCSLMNQLENFNDGNKTFDSFKSIPFFMFGGFIILVGCMISFAIFMFAKKREIIAFKTQQVMPVAKEGIREMTPTVGDAAKTIAKGIKTGLDDSKDKK